MMPRSLRWSPVLALPLLLACSSKPEFTYDVRPGVTVDTFHTIAFDPRELAWISEGQRPVRTASMKALVREALEARGYQMVEPEAAELWVDVVVLRPDKGNGSWGAGKPDSGGHGGGRSGGGMRGGGGRGMGRGRSGADTAGTPPSPEGAPGTRPLIMEGFDPGGELTLTVHLVTRENAQDAWTGSVHLPAQKKGEQPDRRASMRGVVAELLRPLPNCGNTGAR